jgi:hypothetical protein
MADLTTNGLRGCINSLEMTVAPAVAHAGDTLAREQLGLLNKYLGFVSQRVDLIGDRVRFELSWHVEMGAGVALALQRFGQASPTLVTLSEQGRALLARAGARQVELAPVSAQLRTEISRLVRALRGGDIELRRAVEAVVIQCSKPLIEFQRSWFAPQAWESDSEQLPSIETLIALRMPPGVSAWDSPPL